MIRFPRNLAVLLSKPAWVALCVIGWLLPRTATAQMVTGGYTGSGGSKSITGLGFTPAAVLARACDAVAYPYMRTSTMGSTKSKELATTNAMATTAITALSAGGFTVGSTINSSSTPYCFAAFEAVAGSVYAGSYTGNGSTQTISGPGFQPDLVWVLGDTTQYAVYSSSVMPATCSSAQCSQIFDAAGALRASRITGFTSTGFSLGSNAEVNSNTVTYHYVAWKASASVLKVGTYTGSGSARTISGVGFQPEYIYVHQQASMDALMHFGAAGYSTDSSVSFGGYNSTTNEIKSLTSDGFTLGTSTESNASGTTYYYYAFARQSATAVRVDSLRAYPVKGTGMRIEWDGLYDPTSLAFNVYRESKGGAYVRVTATSLQGTALYRQRHYTVTDPNGTPDDEYYIEETGLDGTSRRFGPAPSGDEPSSRIEIVAHEDKAAPAVADTSTPAADPIASNDGGCAIAPGRHGKGRLSIEGLAFALITVVLGRRRRACPEPIEGTPPSP